MLQPTSRRGLTFADAVQILGGGDTPVISLLGRVTGVGAAVVGAATLSSVDLLAVRNEVVEQGQRAARAVRERRAGLSRYDRTQRIVAAHTVLVVSSFFEVFDEVAAEFGLHPARFEINVTEQVALGTGTAAEVERGGIVRALTDNEVPLPSPAVPPEALSSELRQYYRRLITKVLEFAGDLTTGERLRIGADEPWDGAIGAALRRYGIAYRNLAAEVPEFAIWTAMLDAEAGRATTERIGAELRTGLAGLRDLLGRLPTGDASAHRADLAEQYRDDLSRPILDTGHLPDGVRLPATGDLYVNPRGRARRAEAGAPIATDSWWADTRVMADVEPFLAGYLTGPEATVAPLLVLGDPGAGKSMLSKMLAARLPAAEFMLVRVELRAVAADASPHDQIESAVFDILGERVTWPALVRSAGGALPVVILDGFDELLQASGVNRADYLEQVREFQRREADRKRPVAVVVTSRTVVADRVRLPAGSLVLRLEPFDDAQIRCWLRVWAETNAEGLAARSLLPLTPGAALQHRDLAEQPLLLLLLALYDAGENALQRAGRQLSQAGLYERLFTDFARREIGKRAPDAPPDGEPAAIATEIYHLELVAFAMFARGTQVVRGDQLDADLAILLHDDPITPGRHTGRTPLTAAQLMVGRFFFVHESQARVGADVPDRTFEFLHATFGEFLVARLVVGALARLAGEREFQSRQLRPGTVDIGPLYAWLSFAVLTGRGPIVDFCQELLDALDPPVRDGCRALLLELLSEAAFPQPNRSLTDYRPVRLSETARHATVSANLVTLIVLLSPDGVDPEEMFSGDDWRSYALLWRSQLRNGGYGSLLQALRVSYHHVHETDDGIESYVPVARLRLEDGGPVSLNATFPWDVSSTQAFGPPEESLFADLVVPAEGELGGWLRHMAFDDAGDLTPDLAHSLAPYWRYIGADLHPVLDAFPFGTDAAALLELLLAPRYLTADARRRLSTAYLTCLEIFRGNENVQSILMRNLTSDAGHMGPDLALTVLLEAVVADGDGDGSYLWLASPRVVAELLVTAYLAHGDPAQIRAVCGGMDRPVIPESPGFPIFLQRAFAQRGMEMPAELTQR